MQPAPPIVAQGAKMAGGNEGAASSQIAMCINRNVCTEHITLTNGARFPDRFSSQVSGFAFEIYNAAITKVGAPAAPQICSPKLPL